jgi:putative glutamine amidotransferase
MAELPLIGVTSPVEAASPERPTPRVLMKRSYLDALLHFGALPMVLVSSLDQDQLRAAYERLDGLLLPGGADVDPSRYAAPAHPALGDVDPALDAADLALARWAFEDGKPLLGLCRGLQVINVAFGGTLYQDLPSERPNGLDHATRPPDRYRPVHEVALEPSGELARLLGAERLPVNSTHHQAVREPAPGWRVAARAPDGVVEAIEPAAPRPGFVLAVQWHPEELWPRGDRAAARLFEALVAAARRWQATGAPGPHATNAHASGRVGTVAVG